MTPEIIREQAKQSRGVDLTERRSQELAGDMQRIADAVAAARDKLDFNDEPARFAALLASSTRAPPKAK